MRKFMTGTSEYIPHLVYEHAEFPLIVSPHILLPRGYDYEKGKLLLTRFRKVLPSPSFSKRQYVALQGFAEEEGQGDEKKEYARKVAKALVRRVQAESLQFDEAWGCWLLPLRAEYDWANRARYPHIAIPGLTANTSAHQLTYRYLLGIDIPTMITRERGAERRLPIDHLCHNHACCNPYHLQVVTALQNAQRGKSVRRAKQQDSLFVKEESKDEVMPFDAILKRLDGEVKMLPRFATQSLARNIRPVEPHPELFSDVTDA